MTAASADATLKLAVSLPPIQAYYGVAPGIHRMSRGRACGMAYRQGHHMRLWRVGGKGTPESGILLPAIRDASPGESRLLRGYGTHRASRPSANASVHGGTSTNDFGTVVVAAAYYGYGVVDGCLSSLLRYGMPRPGKLTSQNYRLMFGRH